MTWKRNAFALLAACLLIVPSRAAILAYYPFDSGFADAGGGGNDLSIAEGTPSITTTAGEFVFGGGALDLDSTVNDREFLGMSVPIVLAASDAWSVSFWGRRRAGSDNRQGMVLGDTSDTNDFVWIPDNPSQVQGIRLRNSSGTTYDYDGFPDDGGWHHWVLVADGAGGLTVYRDNVSLGTTPGLTTTLTINSVGHAYNTTIHSMNGQIDELYIYDEAIDAAAVNRHFTGIPEPATWTLAALGGLVLLRRRR